MEKISREEKEKRIKHFEENTKGELLCDFHVMTKEDGMMIMTDGKSMSDIITCLALAAGREKTVMHILLHACYVLMKKDKLSKEVSKIFSSMETKKSIISIDDEKKDKSNDDFIND